MALCRMTKINRLEMVCAPDVKVLETRPESAVVACSTVDPSAEAHDDRNPDILYGVGDQSLDQCDVVVVGRMRFAQEAKQLQ